MSAKQPQQRRPPQPDDPKKQDDPGVPRPDPKPTRKIDTDDAMIDEPKDNAFDPRG